MEMTDEQYKFLANSFCGKHLKRAIKRKQKFVIVSQKCEICGHRLTGAVPNLKTLDVKCVCGAAAVLKGY